MKKEEGRSCLFSGAFDDRDEYGGQFVAFVAQGLELRRCDDPTIDQEFEPVGGFLQFAEGIAALGGELRLAPSTIGLAVVRARGRSRPQQLLADHLGLRGLR